MKFIENILPIVALITLILSLATWGAMIYDLFDRPIHNSVSCRSVTIYSFSLISGCLGTYRSYKRGKLKWLFA